MLRRQYRLLAGEVAGGVSRQSRPLLIILKDTGIPFCLSTCLFCCRISFALCVSLVFSGFGVGFLLLICLELNLIVFSESLRTGFKSLPFSVTPCLRLLFGLSSLFSDEKLLAGLLQGLSLAVAEADCNGS